MNEDEQCREWVIFRSGDNEVSWIRGDTWDDYMLKVPFNRCTLISRGHSLTDAINLTMLANEGENE